MPYRTHTCAIFALPAGTFGAMLKNFDTVLVPEINNNGQLVKIIRDVYFVDAKPYNKIMGIPITKGELVDEIKNSYNRFINYN